MKNERFFLLSLALLQFTNIMDFMIMMPLGPQLMRLFQIGPDQFSMAVSAYTISAGISGIAGAFWLDRLDRKQALLLMYGGFLVGTLCCALAPSYLLLVTARIVTGAFGGILGAIVFSIVADTIPEARRGSAMGIVSTSFSMASVFGVPFGLYLATLLSWHAPFYAIVIIGAIIYAILFKVLPPMRSHFEHHHLHTSRWANVMAVLTDPVVRRSLLFMVLLMFGQFSIIPFISPYMVANVGISEQYLPFIYFFGGAATIVSSPLVGKISDAVGKPKVFTFFGIIAVLPVLIITNLPFGADNIFLYCHQWTHGSRNGNRKHSGFARTTRYFHEYQFFCDANGKWHCFIYCRTNCHKIPNRCTAKLSVCWFDVRHCRNFVFKYVTCATKITEKSYGINSSS